MVRQRGIALVMVLWVTVLLTVTVGAFALLVRTEAAQARHLFDSTRARYAAEAGLHRAVFELRNPDLQTRWVADGRSYEVAFEGDVTLTIQIVDESGKIDLNSADEQVLTDLFLTTGIEDELEILQLVDAILDWRDADDLVRLNGAEDDDYDAADYPYGAKDAPFDLVAEVQQVMGMNFDRYIEIEPAVTIYSRQGGFNPAFAPYEALITLPDATPEWAREFIAQRELTAPGEPLPPLPSGEIPVANASGLTYTVVARATLPSGAWSEVEATIRIGGGFLGRPFRILAWRDTRAV